MAFNVTVEAASGLKGLYVMQPLRTKRADPRSRVWNALRVQLGGAWLLTTALPLCVLLAMYGRFLGGTPVIWAAVGNFLAAWFSVHLVRSLSLYPGIRGVFFSFPAVLVSYSLTFSFFLLFRIDYSRTLLLSGALLALAWLYFAQFMAARGPRLRAGVVPFGEVSMLGELASLQIRPLAAPVLTKQFDILVADFRAELPDIWEAFLADCALAGLPVLHVKQLQESLTGKVQIDHLSENSFGSLIPFVAYLRLRRVVDFAGALVVGVLCLPIFLIAALAIKLDTPGPILFRQVRIGYRGKPFHIAKFRTMIALRDESDARIDALTQENDPRVTRVGKILRRLRVDELPQILNILKGEMSWIGPRPEAEPLSLWYEKELPFYRYRHIVPPGITGWAQVNQGHVVELDEVMNKLHYDFYYIKNFSPWLDVLICMRTMTILVTGFGSR